MASKDPPSQIQKLLSRAHSPDSVSRIYSEKIQHRPLFIRATSPPPSVTAREARRKAREQKRRRAKALKPKPLSSTQRRKLGLHDIPKEGQKYEVFEPLNRLWIGYAREILGKEVYTGGQGAAAKLSSADFHGAEVEVSRSSCPSRVGIKGIVVKDTKFTFEIVTRKNQLKIVPKEGTMFRIQIPPEAANQQGGKQAEKTGAEKEQGNLFTFEILGDQFQYRSANRANRKYKGHYLKQL